MAARHLRRGTWHVNHAVTVVDGRGRLHRAVLRRWARPGWELDDPDYTAEREVGVLALLQPTAIPAPTVLAADLNGTECGVPALLLSRLDGRPPRPGLVHLLRPLAETLAAIHRSGPEDGAGLQPYRLYYDRRRLTAASWIGAFPALARACEVVAEGLPSGPAGLIHRDFHPGNTLWQGDRLLGVVDWTQASWGPPALDVGHMRWNLALRWGPSAAQRFLDAYVATSGATPADQPYWDLASLLDRVLAAGAPGMKRQALARLEAHARSSLRALGG